MCSFLDAFNTREIVRGRLGTQWLIVVETRNGPSQTPPMRAMACFQMKGRPPGRFRRRGITLAELLAASAVLALGLAGIHNLLMASDAASARVTDRAAALSLAEAAVADLARLGCEKALEIAKETEPGDVHVVDSVLRSVRRRVGENVLDSNFRVATYIVALENGGATVAACAWRDEERLPAGADGAGRGAIAPPLGSLWETVEVNLYPLAADGTISAETFAKASGKPLAPPPPVATPEPAPAPASATVAPAEGTTPASAAVEAEGAPAASGEEVAP
jgi:hypothetical protein